MNALDRVMQAYLRKYSLTDEQTSRVRAELSGFIDRLLNKAGTTEPPAEPGK